MISKSINCLILLLCMAAYVRSQMDLTFCNIATLPAAPNPIDPPRVNSSAVFSYGVEQNRASLKGTEEYLEYFDGFDNIGVAVEVAAGVRLISYAYPKFDQLLVLSEIPDNKTWRCNVFKLSGNNPLDPFAIDDKQHIISPLASILSNPNLKVVYTGKSVIRGIKVDQWQTCIYNSEKLTTSKVTLSFTDEKGWIPAGSAEGGQKTIPVEVTFEEKTSAGALDSVVFSITRFRNGPIPFPEALYPPPGVYCQGRTTDDVKIPKLPSTFSYLAEITIPTPDSDNEKGLVTAIFNDYDILNKLIRFDTFGQNNSHETEIHDFETGLKYKINRRENRCQIERLDDKTPDGELDVNSHLHIKNPMELFQFDGEPKFQFSGVRKVRGIETNVFIAPRTIGGVDMVLEWHFMTQAWFNIETSNFKSLEPVLLTLRYTLLDPVSKKFKNYVVNYQLSNFDSTRIDIFDFDISACEDEMDYEHLRFTIPLSEANLLKAHSELFALEAVYSLKLAAKVTVLRISQLEIIKTNSAFDIVFTLLDRPRFYGNVEKPQDASLKDAIENLKSTFSTGNFIIPLLVPYPNGTIEEFSVKTNKNSLTILEGRDGRHVLNTVTINEGHTGGSVAGFIIGFFIIGLVVGLVGGVYLILKRNIQLPGPLSFLNPNFSKPGESSA